MGESEMCSFSVIGSLAPESHETYFSVTQHRKLDFDLTVSIVHPMGGIAASVFWIPLR